jgi:scyllo-inositol 2-dehydrogenase (NADP+)
VSPLETPKTGIVHLGLVGFGLAGQAFHAPLVRAVPGLKLACILERHGALAQQKYPDVRVARTLDELLADEEIRLCVIATPNSSHFDLAQRCLLAGRDVVIDKPFTATFEEAAKLIHIAEERGRLLTVFQNRRWDGDFLTVQKLIVSGSLGRVVSYESNYDRYRPTLKPNTWRERKDPGSGILFDLGSHVLDQAFVLFGTPQAVTADVFAEREGTVVDDAYFVRLEYPGMHALLRSNMLACAPGPRFLVHGTNGSFIKHGVDAQEHALRQGRIPSGPEWGENPESEWGTLHAPNAENIVTRKLKTESGDYRLFYANVRDAILQGAPLAVPAREALRTMRALELAAQSSRERRTLPWEGF